MSHTEDEDDGPYWLDGLTPEEQLEEIDARERYVRNLWKNAPPYLAKGAVGSLHANLAHFRQLRRRIAEGLHPTRDDRTPEEKAENARFWAEIDEKLANRPLPPGHRPYNPEAD